MQVQSNTVNDVSFGLRPIAQWRCVSATKKQPKSITIAEIEPKDLEFIKKMKYIAEVSTYGDKIRDEIIWGTLTTIEGILADKSAFLNKVKMFVAIQNYKPCGLLIGNMPKRILSTEGISYSSRHNNAKSETEIDWLATWTPKGEEKLKGTGKALVAEFFGSLKKDKFRDVFVKSELPENSYAQSFYESLGFEALGSKRPQLTCNTTNTYVVQSYDEPTDRIIPMIISRGKLRKCFSELSEKMCRQRFVKTSVDAESLMNI